MRLNICELFQVIAHVCIVHRVPRKCNTNNMFILFSLIRKGRKRNRTLRVKSSERNYQDKGNPKELQDSIS